MTRKVTVLVGTTKGAFLIKGRDHQDWQVSGPFCDGWPINHVVAGQSPGSLFAGGGGEFQGAGIWRSTDGGQSWNLSVLSQGSFNDYLKNDADFARMVGMDPMPDGPYQGEVVNVWSMNAAGDRIYAGAKPATLFSSTDGGVSWDRVQGLADHPSSDSWQPGAAGLTLHTIIAQPEDPGRIWVGISAAGVFASEDGGETWERRNRLTNEAAAAQAHDGHDHGNEVGHCVHNMVRAPAGVAGDLMYQQNHHGVFRSEDGGRSWHDISAGLPSTFGFPIVVDPVDPRMIWTFPLNGDSSGRYPPDASAAVWKSTDGGESWSAKRDGLPGKACFFTVLRQAMATDRATPTGVYFGTNSGSVFGSADAGETWDEIARHLPTVLSVEVLTE